MVKISLDLLFVLKNIIQYIKSESMMAKKGKEYNIISLSLSTSLTLLSHTRNIILRYTKLREHKLQLCKNVSLTRTISTIMYKRI